MTSSVTSSAPARGAFTLIEIVVVIAVIGLLAALLFPAFGRARQSAQQKTCASNLQQIYLAVRQYREDQGHYPVTLETLLPDGSVTIVASGGFGPSSRPQEVPTGQGGTSNPDAPTRAFSASVVAVGTGYLKTREVTVCPSDKEKTNGFTTSYGARERSKWNFFGYDSLGLDILEIPPAAMRLYPERSYSEQSNPVKYSLSNRFAPTDTIVTHCTAHRGWNSNLADPADLGTPRAQGRGAGASDIVLRLDGSAQLRDVSRFVGTQNQPADNRWQIQTGS